MANLSPSGIITLTTDFGTSDHYVGAMKGAILSAFSSARVVDVSHSLNAHAIAQGAYILSAAYSHFPKGTVHVAVVDPGVGGDRRAVAVQTANYWFVAPDSGILSWALEIERDYKARELRPPYDREVSATFHGRDIFAPAAAQLASGAEFSSLGEPAARLVEIERFARGSEPGVWQTKVVHIDRFGNLICGLRKTDLGSAADDAAMKNARITIAGRVISGLSRTYAQVPPRQLFALFSSSGHLEIAVANGSAAKETGAGIGADVGLRLSAAVASAG